jgi:hypothetical protein
LRFLSTMIAHFQKQTLQLDRVHRCSSYFSRVFIREMWRDHESHTRLNQQQERCVLVLQFQWIDMFCLNLSRLLLVWFYFYFLNFSSVNVSLLLLRVDFELIFLNRRI